MEMIVVHFFKSWVLVRSCPVLHLSKFKFYLVDILLMVCKVTSRERKRVTETWIYRIFVLYDYFYARVEQFGLRSRYELKRIIFDMKYF